MNIELPSEAGLKLLAPNKTKQAILRPMTQIRDRAKQSKQELVKYKHAPRFAPAGQSTQLIVGATKESDLHILNLTQALYDSYRLKRVFYSAYVPVVENSLLPSKDTKPTGSIRPTGCCGFTAFAQTSCSTTARRTLILPLTPSAAGRCAIPSSSPSR